MPTTSRHARLLALFDELVEIAPASRASRIADLRNADAALAAELERMFAADDDDAAGVLDRGMQVMAITVGGELQAGAAPETQGASGRRIGPFTLGRLLGHGGMGEVWLAERSAQDFHQQVALKLLKRGMDSEEMLRRFVQERRILADLSHPGIARFVDGGIGSDGAPWYAMEYVDGVPITEHARTHVLGVRARVALMVQIAEAVAYAQTHLVVHRDLKPSNILVDTQGRVRLLDFGIAKLLASAHDGRETATGTRAMSPAYAAPEQILDEPISTATDVYALGVVLYELLTGVLPHQRAGASLETLAESVRHESPETPSAKLRQASAAATTTLGAPTATLQRFAREVAGELDTIVITTLRREPERRYASAAALADDLRRWLDGRPVAAQPDTRTYRMRKFVTRHRLAVGSASAVLLALIAGLAVALWQAGVAREQARIAQEQTQRALHVKNFLVELFAETEGMGRPSDKPRTPLEMVEGGISKAEHDLATDADLKDSVLGDLLDIQVNLGAGAASLALLDRSITYRRAQFGADDPRLADALAIKITALFQQGKFPDTEPLIAECMAIYTKAHGAEHLEVANMQNRLVRVRFAQGRMDEALTLMREVVRKTEASLGADNAEVGLRWSNLATVLLRMKRFDEAQAALQRSLEILEAARGPKHASLAFPLNTLGDLQRELGENAAALATYQRAAEILALAMGTEHPRYAVALNRVGDMQRRQRDFAAAAATLQRAREIQERGKFAELGDTYARLGDLASDQDQSSVAVDWFRQAYEFQLQTQGARSTLTWMRLTLVANALADQGQYDQARRLRNEATTKLAELGKGAERDTAASRFVSGVLERNAGNLDLAIDLQTAARAQLLAIIPADDPSHAALRAQLALTHLLRGTAQDQATAQTLLDQIGTLRANIEPGTAATFYLAQALRTQEGAERERYLTAMDAALALTGSGGTWLRAQREKLRSH